MSPTHERTEGPALESEAGAFATHKTIARRPIPPIDREHFEPACQEGTRRVAHENRHRLAPGQQALEDADRHAPAVLIDSRHVARSADEDLSDMDCEGDPGGAGLESLPVLGRLPDRQGGERGSNRGVLDRLEAERDDDPRRADLRYHATERLQLLDVVGEGATGVERILPASRRDQRDPDEGQVAALPREPGRRCGCRGGCCRVRRSRDGLAPAPGAGLWPQLVLLDPIADLVPRDPESLGRPRHVPPGLVERLEQAGTLEVAHGVLEAGERGRRRLTRRGIRRPARRQPEHLGGQVARLLDERHALDHVAELPDVPGPWIGEQDRPGIAPQRLGGKPIVRARLGQKALGQQDDVVAPLAERRHGEREDGEPVIEVLAKGAPTSCRRQVGVGGGDDPDVDRF